jgi:hypothetical protein
MRSLFLHLGGMLGELSREQQRVYLVRDKARI